MSKKDKLPVIISITALIIYSIFLFLITRSKDSIEGLEGGNIQHAIETGQR